MEQNAFAEPIGTMPAVPADMRQKIDTLERAMLSMPQMEIDPTHYFADGLYAREIFIPKGTILTGKIHRTEHLNIISKGDISVMTEHGIKRIKAPCTMVSKPGTKRVGYAHEDTVWTTIHASAERDLDKLEVLLIAPTYELIEQKESPCQLRQKVG